MSGTTGQQGRAWVVHVVGAWVVWWWIFVYYLDWWGWTLKGSRPVGRSHGWSLYSYSYSGWSVSRSVSRLNFRSHGRSVGRWVGRSHMVGHVTKNDLNQCRIELVGRCSHAEMAELGMPLICTALTKYHACFETLTKKNYLLFAAIPKIWIFIFFTFLSILFIFYCNSLTQCISCLGSGNVGNTTVKKQYR